jgi:hypothetical protein
MDYLQPGHSIHFNMLEAISSVEANYSVSWHEFDATTKGIIIPPSNDTGISNGTTRVQMIGTSANSKQVTQINIYNADTIAHNFLVQENDGSSFYALGRLFLSAGSTAHWNRHSGWSIVNIGDSPSYVLTEFIASGTWTKQSGLKRAFVLCVGAGGGSASGRQGAAGSNRFGGGGAGGGACTWRMVEAAGLPATVAVTIGAGGIGGASQTTPDSNGLPGTAGGDTSFGGIVVAKGGNPGGGGSTAAGSAGTGGQSSACTPPFSPFSLSGSNGTAGNTTTNASGGVGFLSTGAPGGGGGGGINNTNVSGVAANSGGGIYENGVVQAGPNSGASPNGVDDVCTILFPGSTINSIHGIGTGGAGNNPATPNGGDGGRCAGGGGGSGTLNGTPSGKGGDGGDGLCVIFEEY